MRDTTKVIAIAVAAVAVATTDPARAQEQGPPPPGQREQAQGRPAPLKLTFEDAVQRAMAHNPNSDIQLEEVKRAQAQVEQVRSTWLPTLNGNGNYTHLDSDRSLNGNVVQGQDSVNGNITLTVPLISAKNWAATARAKDNREIQKATLVDTRRQAAIQAGRAYLTIIAQRRLLESSQHARDTAKAHEDYSKSRLEGGVGNRLDAVRAAQERATTETRVQNQLIQLARAQESLGVLLGEQGPVDAGDTNLGAPPTLTAALNEAQANRSDIVVQREREESARKSVRDSYTDYLPILTAQGYPFYQDPPTITVPKTGWQASLLLTIPLYDGGLRYGQKHERDALFEQQKTRLEAVLRQARSDVRIAFEAVQRADEALQRAQEASNLAQEALELSQLAYRAGATTNIEVVDAERAALDAETDAATAEDAARQARLDLLSAAGRFP